MNHHCLSGLAVGLVGLLVVAGCSSQETPPAGESPTSEGATAVVPGQPMQPGVPATSGQAGTEMVRAVPAIPMRRIPKTPTPGGNKVERIPTLAPGADAPDFVSVNLAGEEIHLADYRGKIVVLDFWATWCGPCVASMPHTQEVAQRCQGQDVIVLAACTSDARAKFEQFVQENQEQYPDIVFTCDPHERGSDTFDQRASQALYGVRGIPTQFVIDSEGTIAAVLVGYEPGEQRLEAALTELGVNAAVPDAAPDPS